MQSKADSTMNELKRHNGVVPTMCHGCSYGGYNCGILAHVDNGVITKVEGNPSHPLNRGRLCAKGLAAVQWVYNANRLKHPMRRLGKKGDNRFEKVSWEDALGEIADKLKAIREKLGPEYIMMNKGQAASWFGLHHMLLVRFLYALGSPNFTWWSPYICYGPQLMYHKLTVGGPTYARPDYDNAELIIEWFTGGGQGGAARGGVETVDTNLRSVPIKILDRLEQGAKLIVINPQLIPLAANGRADKWVPIRPGTDSALALAMINVVINKGLYDKEFVLRWCDGFEELTAHVGKYTPQWAESITDIPADDIVSMAQEYATTPNAVIRVSEAPQKRDLQSFGVAIPILIAITGHLDRPGGNIWFKPASHLGFDTLASRLTEEVKARALGEEKLYIRSRGRTISSYPSAIQALTSGRPYRPRAMLLYGSNPINTARNPNGIAQALGNLDFLVQFDVTLNHTSCYADLVLPAATRYECLGQPGLWGNHLATSQRVIDPLGQSRDELEVTLDLACRMGFDKDFWHGDYEAMVNDFLSPTGVQWAELKENALDGISLPETDGVATRERYEEAFAGLANGKVQLYNQLLAKEGFDPLPTYLGEPEDFMNAPDLKKDYPLIFTDEHSDYFSHHSWMRDIPWLREHRRHPYVKINPITAAAYEIRHGDWLEIRSPRGYMRAQAFFSQGLRPDTIMGQHGWWQGCKQLGLPEQSSFDGGGNTNVLYDWEHLDAITENQTKNTLVNLKKCSPPDWAGAAEAGN